MHTRAQAVGGGLGGFGGDSGRPVALARSFFFWFVAYDIHDVGCLKLSLSQRERARACERVYVCVVRERESESDRERQREKAA